MNTEIIINIAVVLIALVIVLAIGHWALNAMMNDDAEPTQPTDADRYNQSKRGGK